MVTRTIVLDSGPLGLATNPRGSGETTDCIRWMTDCRVAGATVVVPGRRVPNLGSRVLAPCERCLAADWPARFGHPLLLETFVDPARGGGYRTVPASPRVTLKYIREVTSRIHIEASRKVVPDRAPLGLRESSDRGPPRHGVKRGAR